MQALWTAASGLSSQQQRLDVLSNNIANVDTVGYKNQDVSFQDLLYRQFDQTKIPTLAGQAAANQKPRLGPPLLSLGSGVVMTSPASDFSTGSLKPTGQPLDFSIQGNSFFAVQIPNLQPNAKPQVAYTRDGHFQLAQDASGSVVLATDQGYPVLDVNDQPIDLTGVDVRNMHVAADGTLTVQQNGQTNQIGQIGLNYFDHPQTSLKPAGNNLYAVAQGSTQYPVNQLVAITPQDMKNVGQIRQGFLEQSNVDLTKEMTSLIETQRLFELDAKALSTTDQMMGIANNLRS